MKDIMTIIKKIGKKLDTNSILALTAIFLSCICLLFTSCTDNESISGDTVNHLSLEITSKQWGGQSITRASYSGLSENSGTKTFKTTFQSGDEIGFFAVDKSGKVIIANQKFTLSGNSWTTNSPIQYVSGMGSYTYFAYYPYQPALAGSPVINSYPDITSAETFFASVIADWTPAADQSTEEKFTAQDLMISKGINNMPYFQEVNIKFTMQHQMGLLVTKPSLLYYNEENPSETWEEKQSFETNVPYTLEGNCYFFTKPGVNTTLGDKTTTVDAGQLEQLFFTNGEPSQYDYSKTFLTFVPVEDSTFGFTKDGLSYSLDNGNTWTELAAGKTTPTVPAGSKIMWKNNTELTPTSSAGIGTFSSDNNFDVQGNIMSLNSDENNSLKYYAFYSLFKNTKVRKAENLILPATTLTSGCYRDMFRGCTSLTSAPELPATTLNNSCYTCMFYKCYSLTTAPKLPAKKLYSDCYYQMFSCTALTTAPELPATELAKSCYNRMFSECTALTKAPELPATTLAEGCYGWMFSGCTSLTAAPTLPATTLTESCYQNMFENCTSLTSAPELPATKLERSCYSQMFENCTSLTTAPKILPATELSSGCYYVMFAGCTSLANAPELPATELIRYCYYNMFSRCERLNYVKMAATDISAEDCLTNWLNRVSSTGTFVKNAAATWDITGTSGIPSGWTVETYNP